MLGNLKSIQSNANVNHLINNHGTKVILASSSRFVGWMKAFVILDSNPKMPPRSVDHFLLLNVVLWYANFQHALKPPPSTKLNTHFNTC
jgi:hypothetical protein